MIPTCSAPRASWRRSSPKPASSRAIPIVGYCHLGQQATGTLFAARLLGYNVKLYDGSFEDWSAHTDFPVENPSAKGGITQMSATLASPTRIRMSQASGSAWCCLPHSW